MSDRITTERLAEIRAANERVVREYAELGYPPPTLPREALELIGEIDALRAEITTIKIDQPPPLPRGDMVEHIKALVEQLGRRP